MRIIAIEEHFITPSFVDGPGKSLVEQLRTLRRGPGSLVEKLADIGDGRIAEMETAGIDMQVLSLNAPGVEQAEPHEALACSRDANDLLCEAIKRHPTRYAGLATLPIQVPERAAEELDRSVRTLGLKGANINGHSRGRYLDEPFFAPVLARAEALNVPIYLHPTVPPQPVVEALYSRLSAEVSTVFASSGWGWHIETAVHVLRMILGGVFDRHPTLQVIVGHMGETLPFMLPRLNRSLSPQLTKLARPVADYLRQNVHYTFGGFNYAHTFQNLVSEVGVGRILFSVDYPYGSMAESRSFLNHLPVDDIDRTRIAHRNAESLLHV